MCKIMAVVGIQPGKKAAVEALCRAAAPLLTQGNNDGFGYMATDGAKMYGERWLHVDKAFKQRNKITDEQKYMLKHLGKLISLQETYNSFGTVPKNPFKRASTIVMHARMATNGANELRNTHPFVAKGVALVHNGVVDTSNLTLKTSTCDSEGILNEYLEHNVKTKPSAIDEMAAYLWGYYACVALIQQGNKVNVDLFKDEGSSLSVAYIVELDAFIFSTSPSDIYRACFAAKLKAVGCTDVNPGLLVRLNGVTGSQITTATFGYNSDAGYGYNYLEPAKTTAPDGSAVNEYILKEQHDAEVEDMRSYSSTAEDKREKRKTIRLANGMYRNILS